MNEIHKISIKLFVERDTFAPSEFVPIFHRWIQTHALPEHLLIDVADYAHVHAGPGIVLISSEANIHMDRGENRLGLMYVRKQPIAGATSFSEQLRGTLLQALKAAMTLEQDPELRGRLTFRTNEIVLRVHDRLNAPNDSEKFQRLRPAIESLMRQLHGTTPFALEHQAYPLTLLEVRVRAETSPSAVQVLDRIKIATPAMQ